MSIVVPTVNESKNLAALVARIDAAMARHRHEILIIDDDSKDGTRGRCRDLARKYPVRLFVRDRPIGGLSGAVVEGFGLARGEVFVVMDGDLQHPPEAIPSLIGPILAGEAEFVIGSRGVAGAHIAEEWGTVRRLTSRAAKLLARPLTGRIADPMSGFFAVSCAAIERAPALEPIGFKIGLELLCKCQFRGIVEIPIMFGLRHAGESKLAIKEQWRYLRHLARLYRHQFTSGRRPFQLWIRGAHTVRRSAPTAEIFGSAE